MVEANLKIISELKSFLETISGDQELKKIFSVHPTDFSRDRKLPFDRVVALIFNFLKRSLTIELHEFFDILRADKERCTKGAFSLQRIKLLPLFFECWNYFFVKCFYHYYEGEVKRWRNFRLYAVDGSTNYLFNKQGIKEYFGTHTNQHKNVQIPMARVMQVYDVLNNIIVWGDIQPITKSEQQIMNENINQLPSDSLTLFDRGFPSYTLIYLMLNEEQPRNFVMRCRKKFNKGIDAFLSSNKQTKIIELKPQQNAIDDLRKQGYIITSDTVVKVKVVKVLLNTGEIEILLTSLMDDNSLSMAEYRELYALRWGVETSYGKQKNQLQMEIFSGHTVVSIKQDYFASIFLSNLQSIIKKQSEGPLEVLNSKRKYKYQINNNVSWAAMKHNIVKLFLENNPRKILLQLQALFEQNLEPIRPNRSNPRIKKSKKLLGKYQTFTNYRRAI